MTDEFSRVVTNFFKNDYRERGKVKWNGYFLSDHTSSLKAETIGRHQKTVKLPRMAVEDMKQELRSASINYESVYIQQDVQDEAENIPANIVGYVSGFSDRGVVINDQHILFEDMRAIGLTHDRN